MVYRNMTLQWRGAVKPLRLLALCFYLSVLMLASPGDAEAQVEACQRQARPGWWSKAEHHVWDQTCAGEIANFNKDKKLDLELSCCCVADRRISGRFLQTVLSKKRFRGAVTQRGLRITGACFPDEINLENEHLPWPLELRHSRFENNLKMIGLQADRSISLQGSSFKGVNLWKAQIKGRLEMSGATVYGNINVGSSLIGGSLTMNGVTCEDANFREAYIGGQLLMDNVTVKSKLNMNSASIASHLLMRKFTQGVDEYKNATFDFKEAQIGGQLIMDGASIRDKLNMASTSIGSHLLMRHDATFEDQVTLRFATVGLQLSVEGATFRTLDLRGATIERDLLLSKAGQSVQWKTGVETDEIQLDLRNAIVGTLTADHESWPPRGRLELYGFTYQQLGNLGGDGGEMYEQPARKFIDWLARDKTFSLQPYHQLSTVLRAAGKSASADEVLFAGKNRERGETKNLIAYIGLTVVQWTIGYAIGAYIFLVLIWMAVFVVVGWLFLLLDRERCYLQPLQEPIGLWFSLDYFLPVIRLREDHYEKVVLSHCARTYFYLHQLIGYFFTLSAIAGLTNMIQ